MSDHSNQGSHIDIPKTIKTNVFMLRWSQLNINYIFKHYSPLKDQFHHIWSSSIPQHHL